MGEIPFRKPRFSMIMIRTEILKAEAMQSIILKLARVYIKDGIDLSTPSLTLTFNEVSFVKCSIWVKSYTSTVASAFIIYLSFILNTFSVRKRCSKTSLHRIRLRQGFKCKLCFLFLASLQDFRRCSKDNLG